MGESIRVLHVEDDANFAALTAEYLRRADERFAVERVGCLAAATERICGPDANGHGHDVDCVVSDFDLPKSDGIALVERVRRVETRLPFILFTGKGSEEVASDALAAGATDYLQKERSPDQFTVLANRIENAVARYRAVKELEQHNDRHREAEAIANLGTWELDLQSGDVWLSEGGYRTLGLPQDYDPDPRTGLAHYHPDDRPAIAAALERSFEHHETVDVEARYVGGDGDQQWVRVRGNPQVRNGEVVSIRATIQDVTRHKEREVELERYETVVQAVGDPVYALDAEGRFRFVNDALLAATDYERDGLLGEHVSVCVDDADLERGRTVVRRLRGQDDYHQETVEVDVVDRNGDRERCEVQVALLPAEEGFRGTVGVVRSVEACKQRERELRRFEAIMETAPVGVVFLDEDAVIAEWNERASSVVGLDREAWVGEPFDALVDAGIVPAPVRDEYLDGLCELLDEETDTEVLTMESEIAPADRDGARLVEVHLTLLPYDCEFEGAVGIFRDVTEERARERALQRKTDRLQEFANLVGHDLRNPLNVVQSRLELAQRADDRSDHLRAAADSVDRMARIIDDVLTLARLGERIEEPEQVHLAPLARRAWPDETDATLEITDEVTVQGDPARLRTALTTLFENAIEHGGAGGTVTVGGVTDGFYVADDGPGVLAEDRERIFEPGYTTDRGGTGMGLVIVEHVAAAHGWAVSVAESEAGGARFELVEADGLV